MASLLLWLTGCGDQQPSISTVKEMGQYVIKFATEKGEIIEERATTLAAAIRRLWRRVFPVRIGDVVVNADDPLRGRLQGVYDRKLIVIDPEGGRNESRITLRNPAVRRSSPTSEDWQIDRTNPDLPDWIRSSQRDSQTLSEGELR